MMMGERFRENHDELLKRDGMTKAAGGYGGSTDSILVSQRSKMRLRRSRRTKIFIFGREKGSFYC